MPSPKHTNFVMPGKSLLWIGMILLPALLAAATSNPSTQPWKQNSYVEVFHSDNQEFKLYSNGKSILIRIQDQGIAVSNKRLLLKLSSLLDVPATFGELDEVFLRDSNNSHIQAQYGLDTPQGKILVSFTRDTEKNKNKMQAQISFEKDSKIFAKADITPTEGLNAAAYLRMALMFLLTGNEPHPQTQPSAPTSN